MITIIDNHNHEWAVADSMSNAIFALRKLVLEEGQEFRALDSHGKVLAWAFPPHEPEGNERVVLIQGARI